jgi:hypothetical protein
VAYGKFDFVQQIALSGQWRVVSEGYFLDAAEKRYVWDAPEKKVIGRRADY